MVSFSAQILQNDNFSSSADQVSPLALLLICKVTNFRDSDGAWACSLLDGRCSDEATGAMAVARAMSRLAVLRSVVGDISSQLQV